MTLNILKPSDFVPDWPTVLFMAHRREIVEKNIPRCTECASEQVQLVSWYTDQLRYKCRRCKHKFEMQFEHLSRLQ
jgi:transposase-like protein